MSVRPPLDGDGEDNVDGEEGEFEGEELVLGMELSQVPRRRERKASLQEVMVWVQVAVSVRSMLVRDSGHDSLKWFGMV